MIFIEKQPSRTGVIHRIAYIAIALCFAVACGGKKKSPGMQEKIRAAMSQFFLVVPNPKMAATGIWVADAASVTAMIEKKYLANYVAKPDEPQANEIRERLKSLKIFFRVEAIRSRCYRLSPIRSG